MMFSSTGEKEKIGIFLVYKFFNKAKIRVNKSK